MKSPRTSSGAESDAMRAILKKELGGDVERILRDIKQGHKKEEKEWGAATGCWSCGKDASKLMSGQGLRACSRCKGVGRVIRYCSRYVSASAT